MEPVPLKTKPIAIVSLFLVVCAVALYFLGGRLRIIPDRLKDLDTYFERTEDQVLIRAVLDGDKRRVRRAVEAGADVNAVGDMDFEPVKDVLFHDLAGDGWVESCFTCLSSRSAAEDSSMAEKSTLYRWHDRLLAHS